MSAYVRKRPNRRIDQRIADLEHVLIEMRGRQCLASAIYQRRWSLSGGETVEAEVAATVIAIGRDDTTARKKKDQQMAAWRHRIVRDVSEKRLHFVFARYDADADRQDRCRMVEMLNEGDTIDDMRRLVRELDAACTAPIIVVAETAFELDAGERMMSRWWKD